jgi:uncharacterized protein (TIGR02757 family)
MSGHPRVLLKRALDRLYETYDFKGRAEHDPIRIPLRYRRRDDREAAGFLAAALAYGRVDLFLRVLDALMEKMGKHPAEFMASFRPKRDMKRFQGIKYRFNETEDIGAFIYTIGSVLKRHGSLERAFMNYYDKDHHNIGQALAGLMDELGRKDTSPVYGTNARPMGYRYLMPSPSGGGASKRPNLFLRWMVRRADIDLGLWKKVPPSKLVIPLDRHISRVGRCLGLTMRKTDDWKTAVEITESLRRFDPEDPLRYDFALCHRGISGVCSEHKCEECELSDFRPALQ